jgi:hypothetical protein
MQCVCIQFVQCMSICAQAECELMLSLTNGGHNQLNACFTTGDNVRLRSRPAHALQRATMCDYALDQHMLFTSITNRYLSETFLCATANIMVMYASTRTDLGVVCSGVYAVCGPLFIELHAFMYAQCLLCTVQYTTEPVHYSKIQCNHGNMLANSAL